MNELKPGVAPVLQEAPRVTSGTKSQSCPFEPLLAYRRKTDAPYRLKRSEQQMELEWAGVRVAPRKLAELLQRLPRGKRIEGATRVGKQVASFSFDGKLRRSRLKAPAKNGLVLLWTEPQGSCDPLELPPVSEASFRPQGERLGGLRVEKGGKRIKASIYRSVDLEASGFVLLRSGSVKYRGGWLGVLKEEESARFCQVVVEGDLEWGNSVPAQFRSTFRKLAKLAVQKSQELEESTRGREAEPLRATPTGDTKEAAQKMSSDLVDVLLQNPRFLAAYQNKRNGRPPLATLGQILKLLCNGGGQRSLETLRDHIGLSGERLTEILTQMDAILGVGEEVVLSLSIDGSLLLIDRERLCRLFALQMGPADDAKLVRGETLEGLAREVRLPLEVTLKERCVLEALLRYGRLSEGELSQMTGSRRVGGLLEKLLSRLEDEGFFGLAIAGEGEQGRIFQLLP